MDSQEHSTDSPLKPYGLIYKITNMVNGKVYIGQTVQTLIARWKQHIKEMEHGSNYIFHNALRKYGPASFEKTLLCFCESIEELNAKEREYCTLYNAMSPHGYNLRAGNGKGATSEELKEKIRAGLKGKAVYQEAVRASVAVRTGKALTPEHKAKISAGNKGQRKGEPLPEATMRAAWSPESRRKMVAKLAGIFFFLSPMRKQVLVINLNQFCRDHNLEQSGMWSISAGKSNEYKGWRLDPNRGMPSFPGVPPLPRFQELDQLMLPF